MQLLNLLRPRRRWFQFSLRTLFVLTTLLSLWLSYNAWTFHTEREIVAGIKARDPKVEITWAGPAWLQWYGEDLPPTIFHRVREVAFGPMADVPKELSELRLQELRSLQTVVFSWDVEAQQFEAIRVLMPGVEFQQVIELCLLSKAVEKYQANSTETSAAEVFKQLKCFQRDGFSAMPLGGEPSELRYSCCVFVDGEEEALAVLLTDRHEDFRVAAAECLWKTRSRRHAREVLAFVDGLHAQSDAAKQLKEKVETDLQTLRKPGPRLDDNPAWWAWLAALRPNPAMLPTLEELALRKPPVPEAIYALGQSKDDRALEPLLKVLSTGDDQVGGYAAEALGELGNPDAEPDLARALQRKGQFLKAKACKALGKIGTERALPELSRLAANKGYQGAINVTGCAKRAIAEIEGRIATSEESRP